MCTGNDERETGLDGVTRESCEIAGWVAQGTVVVAATHRGTAGSDDERWVEFESPCVEQYLCSNSAASLTSPMTFRASIMLAHVGCEYFSHLVRVASKQSAGSLYCLLMASSVQILTPSCIPIYFHFVCTLFNSFITTRKSATLSTGPGFVSMSPLRSNRTAISPTTLLARSKRPRLRRA